MGKMQAINLKANKILKQKFVSIGKPERCEKCGGTWALSFAHRHRRIFYLNWPEGLSEINQVLILCVPCHFLADGKPQELENLFIKLRGREKI